MSGSEGGQRRMGQGQPIFIMSDDVERTQGRDAQAANIEAGKAVAESVRTTLGPNGMDKMLVSDDGDVVVTNDGATILDEMDIEHPAAQMIAEVAESQEEEVGDGTTTAAVIAGELLAETEDLLEQDVHPTTIVQGFNQAAAVAVEAIEEITLGGGLDDEMLQQVAVSSMTGKGTGGATADVLAEAVVRAVRQVETAGEVDTDSLSIVTQPGRASTATELIEGVVFEAEPERDDMPGQFDEAAVAVLDTALEQPDTEADVEYSIGSTDQLNAAVEAEQRRFQEYVDAVLESGADVVFSTEGVADQVSARLSKEGILVFDNQSDDDAAALAKATGAARVGALEDLVADALGTAESIRTESYEEDFVFIEGGADAAAVTLFVRAGTGQVLEEIERAVSDGVDSVVAALESDAVVPGAGASEIAAAAAVREAAAGIEGREQLAVEAFADALDVIPRTLASNAGMDPIDALVELRAANESGNAGVIGSDRHAGVSDPVEAGVLDPATVKREAVESATEAATMIARIDDVISAN
jgi:thermosome